MIKKTIFITLTIFLINYYNSNAEVKKFNMVFVPASEKGDENDYTGLVNIVNSTHWF